jgi:flagellar biosynthesis protein
LTDDYANEDKRAARKRAVALQYEPAKQPAPRVVATGAGPIAERIIAAAKENGIPIREEPDLVEMLASLDLSQIIPPELYVAIAEILAFVHQLNRKYVANA